MSEVYSLPSHSTSNLLRDPVFIYGAGVDFILAPFPYQSSQASEF